MADDMKNMIRYGMKENRTSEPITIECDGLRGYDRVSEYMDYMGYARANDVENLYGMKSSRYADSYGGNYGYEYGIDDNRYDANVLMESADAPVDEKKEHSIVCLCGSSRFKDEFEDVSAKLTLHGYIVLSLGVFSKSGDKEKYDIDYGNERLMDMLDEMQKQKIAMSDMVYVVNPGGYVGDGTKAEIAYAKECGKHIMWLEADAVGGLGLDDEGNIVYKAVS